MTTITSAVVRDRHHAPLPIEQLDLDEPRANEVRLRLVATGVCHTEAIDVHGSRTYEYDINTAFADSESSATVKPVVLF
jgi:Zn-dependent alcohol dehydrogenase